MLNKKTFTIGLLIFLGLSINMLTHSQKETEVRVSSALSIPSSESQPDNAAKDPELTFNEILASGSDNHPFYEKESKARLLQIAQSFSEDIKYPDNSKPIRNIHELDKYTPNKSTTSSRNTNINDPNSPTISIKASKHQYFTNETIQALASIHQPNNHSNISVSTRLVANGKTVTEGIVIPSSDIEGQYNIEFSSETLENIKTGKTIRIIVNFKVDQRSYEIGTPIQYEKTVAQIDYVDQAFVNQAYLHIPIYINTSKTGYHLLSANLYNPKNDQALLHLSEQKNLSIEKDFIELKAHISALKLMGYEGPYELRDLSLTRMPSKPEYLTQYGKIHQESFEVNGFSFSDYSDEAYLDPDAQQRLDFLTQLGAEPSP